ncbi:MAG: hypothetical protein HUU41_02205 [Bryobacteraceae bacterium]|nr:hypothetical protein [Bryobacterales bacterium]MEB2363433.1 hypothetical protein [Bryobacterales bacterium]NUM99901.1 hypothetical protein [Bryobacteraceae bacterium]
MREARDITWMDNGAVLVGSKAGHEARRPTDRLALFSPLPPVDAARLRDASNSNNDAARERVHFSVRGCEDGSQRHAGRGQLQCRGDRRGSYFLDRGIPSWPVENVSIGGGYMVMAGEGEASSRKRNCRDGERFTWPPGSSANLPAWDSCARHARGGDLRRISMFCGRTDGHPARAAGSRRPGSGKRRFGTEPGLRAAAASGAG